VKVLVTGGAGFIGSHLVDALLAAGHEVRVLDNLDPQVHGAEGLPPAYLSAEAELHVGDVRDGDAVERVLEGVEAVFHHAAAVGVGQSMYEMARYTSVNSLGTATLLEKIAERPDRIQKLVVASSMSVYGEGAYRDPAGRTAHPKLRSDEQLDSRGWDLLDDRGRVLDPIPTHESKPLHPTSIYAITKRDQEEMFLVVGETLDIPTVALRYFNSYGRRQALSNPYTGLDAIFASRLLNEHAPIVFEDGRQMRDFVHVSDVVQANLLALDSDITGEHVFNVGTGRPRTVLNVAETLSKLLESSQTPEVLDRCRVGDIRHCYADISRIEGELGFRPKVEFEEGMGDLLEWLHSQRAEDHVQEAQEELIRRNLTRLSRPNEGRVELEGRKAERRKAERRKAERRKAERRKAERR
jgi:dTDP-L-rhamnose 4-epimerase